MNIQSYPLGLAIKNAGGRKAKANRHIRSARQRRKAFESESVKLQSNFERTHGIRVDIASDHFWEMKETDPRFAKLHAGMLALRERYFGW